MKIVSLNTWGGLAGSVLPIFFETHRDIDVFLLQEVFSQATEKTVWDEREDANLFATIGSRLPDHTGYFAPSVVHEWGLAAFVKNTLPVQKTGSAFVHRTMDSLIDRDGASIGKNIQFIEIERENGTPLTIVNFHGLWAGHGVGKGDTPDRIEQSKKVVDFMRSLSGDVILGGDFNLNPETESLQMIPRDLGLRDLIKEYGIPSTRTSFYQKPGKFADYFFTSPHIPITHFRVLPDEVSDHAALFLEI
jgi:endonuclease/exonuclease/phosphatase family metal-dependent hydrolase